MPRYAGTPQEYDWEKVRRRRELNDALMLNAMSPSRRTEIVGSGPFDFAVDTRASEGISKIGQAIIAAMSSRKADKDEKEIKEEYETGRKSGLDKVTAALTREPENYVEKNPAMKEPDYMAAGMELETNPYLKDSDIGKALVQKAIGGGQGRGGYSKTFEGEDGRIYSMDMRDPNAQPRLLSGEGGEPLYSPKYTPRALYGQNRAKQLGTGVAEAETDPVTAQRVRQAESNVDLKMKPEIKKETALAERAAEKIITKPKIDSSISAQETKTGMLDAEIDQALGQANIWTTGFLGSATEWVPGTPAHDLGNTLATIKSNIGFDKLQEMRNNSPTGGALGQVSEFENRLLQSVWGALEQSQSPAQFKENLEKVRKQSQESWKRINEAYEQDYGVPYKEPPKAGRFDEEKEKRYQEWKARQ